MISQRKTLLLLFVMTFQSPMLFVHCQDYFEDATTYEPDQETTTAETFETTLAPIDCDHQTLNFKFSSLIGGFSCNINFTNTCDNPDATVMSMKIYSDPKSVFSEQVCTGKIKLIAVIQPTCERVTPGANVDGDIIADIDKPSKLF